MGSGGLTSNQHQNRYQNYKFMDKNGESGSGHVRNNMKSVDVT